MASVSAFSVTFSCFARRRLQALGEAVPVHFTGYRCVSKHQACHSSGDKSILSAFNSMCTKVPCNRQIVKPSCRGLWSLRTHSSSKSAFPLPPGGDDSDIEMLFPPSISPSPSGSGQKSPFPGVDVPEAPEEVKLVACLQSDYSPITVLEFPNNPAVFGHGLAGSRILKLDTSNNIHSMYHPAEIWTGSYWDDLASVASLAPRGGSVGILGLGAGTISRAILAIRPDLFIEGWEIDEMVVTVSRDFLGLKDQEEPTAEGGKVVVHISDAMDAVSASSEGFDCLVVDLFLAGELLEKLSQVQVWKAFKQRMVPGGRLVVNCGGPSLEPTLSAVDPAWQATMATMRAVLQAFSGCCFYKCNDEKSPDANFLVMAGTRINVAESMPNEVSEACQGWKLLNNSSPCFSR